MRRITVSAKSAGQRADIVVAAAYPKFSRSSLRTLFSGGHVKVNGELVRPGHKLQLGNRLVVDDSILTVEPQLIKLPVVYQDDDVVIIDKPAGVLTHSKGVLNLEPTVASFLKKLLTDKTMASSRAGIVHRLDRDTSGLIICARTTSALAWLQKQFSSRKVKKVYQAIVNGIPKEPRAIIEAPIERNPKRPNAFRVGVGGKQAQTEYQVIKSFSHGSGRYSLIKLIPITGRTHQIRVHLAYIGNPVVGDKVYSKGNGEMLLHSSELDVTLPNKQRQHFKAALPVRFTAFIQGS